MSEVKFYEIAGDNLGKTLPQLLYKIYDQTGEKLLLILQDAAEIELYNKLFWTFSSNKFLPHGTVKDGPDHYGPLLLTDKLENLNQAKILVSTKYLTEQNSKDFAQEIYVFSQNNNQQFLDAFHKRKDSGETVSYWQQDAAGKWQKI